MIKITERGWGAHYILNYRCTYRRNTLIERGERRVVVSSVGNQLDRNDKIETVGFNRWMETMAFVAIKEGPVWEACIGNQVTIDGDCGWYAAPTGAETTVEYERIHNAVVAEISHKMATMDAAAWVAFTSKN